MRWFDTHPYRWAPPSDRALAGGITLSLSPRVIGCYIYTQLKENEGFIKRVSDDVWRCCINLPGRTVGGRRGGEGDVVVDEISGAHDAGHVLPCLELRLYVGMCNRLL